MDLSMLTDRMDWMGWESTRERPFESEDAKGGGVRKGGWMGGEKMMEGKLERLGAWGPDS